MSIRRIPRLVVAVVAAAAVLVAMMSRPLPPIVTVHLPVPRPVMLQVQRSEDAAKPGDTRSVMVQRMMTQAPRTAGPSPDQLRLRFDAPALILGVSVSVDIDGPAIAELAVGVNTGRPYGMTPDSGDARMFDARDWLLHASDSTRGERASKVDEQAWFGEAGVELAAGDQIVLDAWLVNVGAGETQISPEMIVFYRWLPIAG